MEILVFLKGLVIGFSIAAPVGPIGVLVIKRTLSQGRIYGIVSGVGAASADTVYGLIAGLFKESLKKQTLIWINRLAGLIIFLFGIYSFWGLLH